MATASHIATTPPPAPDFELVFQSLAGPAMLLDTQLTIIDATDSYLAATMTRREDIVGRYIFDIFPDNPDTPDADGVKNLRFSLEKVLREGVAHSMATQKYDIRQPASAGGCFEERYWSPTNTPILGRDGKVQYVLHSVIDVTDYVRREKTAPRVRPDEQRAFSDISEVLDLTHRELTESRIFLKNIINAIVDPIFVKDRQHRWIMGNNALWALFGRQEDDLLGKSDYDFFPKDEADIFWQKDEEVFNSGVSNVNIENFTDASGKKHIISTKKACFTMPNDEQVLVGVIRDITELYEMQERLKRSDEARLKAIMDHSGCIVYIKDLDGRYLQANKDLLELMGQKEGTLLGKTDHDIFPKSMADRFRENDLKVIESGSPMEFEEIAPDKEGQHVYRSVKFPLYDTNNVIYAVCGLSTDITDRKKEEDAAALLASIVTSSDDAIISRALDGTITSWNTGAETLFGYSAAEAIGQNVQMIVPPELVSEESQLLAQLHSGKSIKGYETIRLTKEGGKPHISLTISPIHNSISQIVGVSMVARDVTQRKEVESQLMRYTWELERSNQELDDFAYIASHDLKEPLRGVFNHASFLLEDYGDKLNEEGVHRLHRLSSLAQRMEHLINDLLYFSRLGRTQLAIRETDPNAVVDEIQQMLDGVLQGCNARIVVKTRMPSIVCDKPRITEVFRNLITNAIKYNDKVERIVEIGHIGEMETRRGREKDVFYVRDNGIGINPEFHEEIFRIFKRLNKPANEKEAGTGVGLTFVKKIIERHNGHIWLESEPGNGSTFYFTIGKKLS